MRDILNKFRTKHTLLDIKPPTRLRRVQTDENNQLLIRRHLQQLGVWTI